MDWLPGYQVADAPPAPAGAWVKFFSRSSRRATTKCVVGDNYETIFLAVDVRRIAPERNAKESRRNLRENGGRLVESNSTLRGGLRNRVFGVFAISPTLHWCEISCCGFSIFPGST